MQRIKIIRHSERLDYSYPIYWLFCFGHPWSDSPLTKKGHNMAKNKGKNLQNEQEFYPGNIYTSPYSRTMSTATAITKSFPKSQIIIEPLLAEHQPMFKDKPKLYPDGIPTTYNGETTDFSYPESYENFIKRVEFIIPKLIEKNTDDILIVTHGEVLKCFISYLQDKFPDVIMDPGKTPYLTTLHFKVNENKEIDGSSIYVE